MRKITPVLSFVVSQLIMFWRVFRKIWQYDVLVVNAYSSLLLLPVLVLTRSCKAAPIVFLRVVSNPVEKGRYFRSAIFEIIYDLSIKLSSILFDRLFFISPMLGEMYSRKLHLGKEKIAVWPSPVDTSVFDPDAVMDTKRLRQELGLCTRVGFLYHGVLTKGRGIIGMVEAFKILQMDSVKARLILLGHGPLKDDIARYVETNDMEEYVEICGPVDYSMVPSYIAACDAGLMALPDHPWWRYQCPTKVLEYLAMNKPLIVSDIPAHRWILDSIPLALYMQGTDPRDIAEAVHTYLRKERSHDMITGRDIARRFSMGEIAKMLEQSMLSSKAKTLWTRVRELR
jgi:glycosyltransferase involved in cell wall biosynthesis